MNQNTSNQETSFEDKLKELEAIVDRMERGEQSLEDSLQDFQNGMKIVKECQRQLKEAELRIVKVTMSEDSDCTEN